MYIEITLRPQVNSIGTSLDTSEILINLEKILSIQKSQLRDENVINLGSGVIYIVNDTECNKIKKLLTIK